MARTTIMIPTYNRSSGLCRALSSLASQTNQDFRVIISDDGSTDSTHEMLSRWHERLNLTVVTGENSGLPTVPRNHALPLVDSEFVAFLDSDDWWSPTKLERSLEYMRSDVDVIFHDLFYSHNERKGRLPRTVKTRSLGKSAETSLLRRGNGITTSSVVVRTQNTLTDLLFSEDRRLRVGEDFVAWLSLARLGLTFRRVPECLGFYSYGNGVTTAQNVLQFCDYAEEIFFRNARTPTWLNFAKGRALFDLRKFDEARQSLRCALGQRGPARTHREWVGAWYLYGSTFRESRRATLL